MKKAVLELEMVTPMFIGSPSGKGVELRIPPIRGQIRYWFRAITGQTGLNTNQLFDKEEKIFGSTSMGSIFSLRLENLPLKTITTEMLPHRIGTQKNPLLNTAYAQHNTYNLEILPRSGLDEGFDSLVRAILLWINFGGVGKRARRGFGNVQTKKLSLYDGFTFGDFDSLFDSDHYNNLSLYQSYLEKLLSICLNSPIRTFTSTSFPTFALTSASFPGFLQDKWFVIITDNPFDNYQLLMQDFWRNFLRNNSYMDDAAYGFVDHNNRHASPIHFHVAKINNKSHLVMTAFYSNPTTLNNWNMIKDLCQGIMSAYGGIGFY